MPSSDTPKGKAKAPISSLASAVVTDETLSLLADAGLSAFRGSEAQALSLLTDGDDSDFAPVCYGVEFKPASDLCFGCVFASTCWRMDKKYLTRLAAGKASPPKHVPTKIVERFLPKKNYKIKALPPKPKKRRQ